MRLIVLLVLGFLAAPVAHAQNQAEEFRVYTEHPRLFLRPQRMRLLKRERERQSMRWRQFETLILGKAQMPEPGFALGLFYAITGNAEIGKQAVEWALGPGSDLRQLALVYDWCQDALTEGQSKALSTKIRKALSGATQPNLLAQRARLLATIAIAEQDQGATERILRDATQTWWRAKMAPELNAGAELDPGAEVQALLEILHAERDNLNIDLRSDAPKYFKTLPEFEVLCNYPAPYPATENEYRIPVYKELGDPDVNRAALARAAGLSTVAYDSNALECQFLQGWLIQDRFILRGVFGAPYEFLWANPYQPGLAYAHLPTIFHDERSGTLLLRSSWDEDATWFALYQGQAQLFNDGKITVLTQQGPLRAKPEPIELGKATIIVARDDLRFKADNEQIFVIGGKPRAKYDVEVDDEELTELDADAGGTVELRFKDSFSPGVRIKETANAGNK